MTLSNDNFNQILLYLGKYQKQIHFVILLLLSLYLIAFAAELTWKLIPEPNNPATSALNRGTGPAQSNASRQQVNIAELKRLHLFGELGAEPQEQEPVVTDAPETSLNLTLFGVIAAASPETGVAIIGNKGKQATYAIGEDIDGTRASLQKVYADRVILRNGARNETLMMEGVEYSKAIATQQTANTSAKPRASSSSSNRSSRPRLSRQAAEATRQIQSEPGNFTDFINIAPFTQEGELQGYRVSPGKKPELFREAGFKAGDVVVDINGLDLRDAQQALEAMKLLRESESFQLTISRDGELETLYLDIPEQD